MRDRVIKNATDRSGLEGGEGVHRYMGVKNSFDLHQNVDHTKLQEYVRYKFVLYDHVETFNAEHPDFGRIAEALGALQNVAFVAETTAHQGVSQPPPFAQPVSENSNEFQVTHFDINSIKIKTNLPSSKFLVYNDSFHSGWRAFVDRQETKILRANIAFKGIWVPAGIHTIEFRYGAALQYYFYWFLVFFFLAFLVYFMGEWISAQRAVDRGAG